MDLLHSWGVEVTAHLQTAYSSFEGLFSLASTVADLRTAFFWLFPVWFYLRRDTALRLVWVAVIGDWLNVVLKWVFFGERPYWWVHETQFYGEGPVPSLKQFPITCETGPGSPSGHAMSITGVWYVMITALLSIAREQQCPPLLYKYLQIGLWSVLLVLEVVVGMSRVYVAAHFPHQVVVGAIIGFIVVQTVSSKKWIYSATMRMYLLTILSLTCFTLGFYFLLTAVGVDLLWTLEKAQRWCVRPDWIHVNSTPLATLLRNLGTLLGLGLGLHWPLRTQRKDSSAAFKWGCIATSLVLLQLLDGWTFSPESRVAFHLLCVGKNAVALLIPTALVPSVLCRMFKGKEDKDL